MGTWASIFINTNNLDAVTSKLQKLSNIDTLTKGEFPTADLYNNLLFDDNAKPTYLVFTNTQPEWIMIRHNGFKNLKNWGEELSDYFKTKVIITCAQSNASFYHFSLFDKGEMLSDYTSEYFTTLPEETLPLFLTKLYHLFQRKLYHYYCGMFTIYS